MNLSKCRLCLQTILMPVLAASLCAGLGSGCKTGFLARRRRQQPELLGPRSVVPAPYTMPAPESAAPAVSELPAIELPDDILIDPPLMPAEEDLPTVLDLTPPEPDTIQLPPTVGSELLTYTVKKGDTLWEIAKAYGITYQELADFNDMDVKDTLVVGTVLRIPPGGHYVPPEHRDDAVPTTGTTDPPATTPTPAPPSNTRVDLPEDGKYTVKSGDSLWVISRRFGVPIDTIRRINQLQNDVLQIGQVLVLKEEGTATPPAAPDVIPETADPGAAETTASETPPPAVEEPEFPKSIDHQVCEGDTLAIIAEMYDSDAEAIKRMNPNIAGNDDLAVGTIITVPYHD